MWKVFFKEFLQRKISETLERGPIYFFDQPKTKRKWLEKMERGQQFADLISVRANPHETRNFCRNPGCTEEHKEGNDALVKNNIVKKDPVSPQTYGRFVSRAVCEDPLAQPSQIPSDSFTEDFLQSASLYEYKCMAVAILCELEEMLKHFSKSKFILPQGILNILNCSWKELTEGAWYNKNSWQELGYRNVKSGRRQASELPNRLSPASEYADNEMAENIKRGSRKSLGFPIGVAKQMENPGPLLNRTVAPQQYASDSPIAISFSLSSKLCKERGWVFQHSESDSKDQEWKIPCIWAVERLRVAKIQITEQLSTLKESGFDKPVILRHYGDVRKETFPKNIKGCTSSKVSSEVQYEKPQLPKIKQIEPAFKKLHYGLIDGSSFIYYPSGHFAVCQSYSELPGGGLYTNIFNDFPDRALLGTFTPLGCGSVCFPNSNIAMMFNQEGGMMTNKDGEILRHWKWPGAGKLDNPVIIQETTIPGIPTGELSHIKDMSATRELRKLRQKIKNILEDWIEYYRRAFGISSPRIQKPSTFPQRGRRCKTQLAGASLDLQIKLGEEKSNSGEAPVLDNPLPFQSAPSCTRLTHDVSSGSCRPPHLSSIVFKTNQPFITFFRLNKDKPQISPKTSEKACCASHTACPVALRRTMLGGEVKTCRCSNHQIPYITDLEYNSLINNQVSSPEQIMVVCVTASLRATDYDASTDEHLEQLYERKNKNRSMPCTQGHLDSFRLLRYDINSADGFTDHCGSLLVKRHNIAPGMFLMYIQGKLLFANYIFNGYSKSVKDLQKQIALTRNNFNRGYYLPTNYRFSYPEQTQASISEDISRCVCNATGR